MTSSPLQFLKGFSKGAVGVGGDSLDDRDRAGGDARLADPLGDREADEEDDEEGAEGEQAESPDLVAARATAGQRLSLSLRPRGSWAVFPLLGLTKRAAYPLPRSGTLSPPEAL